MYIIVKINSKYCKYQNSMDMYSHRFSSYFVTWYSLVKNDAGLPSTVAMGKACQGNRSKIF